MRKLIAPIIMGASLATLWSAPALAYIGPGAGITMLGALWGVVVAILLAIGAVLLWPIRILFRRRRKGTAETAEGAMAEMSEAQPNEAQPSEAGEAEQSARSS